MHAEGKQPTPLWGSRTANLSKTVLIPCRRICMRKGELIYEPTRCGGAATNCTLWLVLGHPGKAGQCSCHSLWSTSPNRRGNKQMKRRGKGLAPPASRAIGTPALLHLHPLVLYMLKAEEQSLGGKDKEFWLSLSTQIRDCKRKMTWI